MYIYIYTYTYVFTCVSFRVYIYINIPFFLSDNLRPLLGRFLATCWCPSSESLGGTSSEVIFPLHSPNHHSTRYMYNYSLFAYLLAWCTILYFCLSLSHSLYIYIYIYIHLSIHLSIYLSIHPSIHPSISLSLYIYIYLYYVLHVWEKMRPDIFSVLQPPGQRSKDHQGSAFGRQRRWWGPIFRRWWLRSILVDMITRPGKLTQKTY